MKRFLTGLIVGLILIGSVSVSAADTKISPLNIAEPATWQDIDNIFNNNDVVIDGNGRK